MSTVLIAPDKFKGSLTATEVARSLSTGLTTAGLDTIMLPLADGGDGSVAAALAAGFSPRTVTVRSATGTEHCATIAVRGRTAVVEIANTCGLATLEAGRRAPMAASSFGFGQAIRHAVEFGARHIVLALGGSASSDAGTGMLGALGFGFYDRRGTEIVPTADNLSHIHRVDPGAALAVLSAVELTVASDVTNPLTGPEGAAAVYGPQKGAGVADIDALENGYEQLIHALEESGFGDAPVLAGLSGAGAAGGCGFAAMLLGARVSSGADFFLDLLDFESAWLKADLVITGEGRLDTQTLRGKLPSVVARRASPTPTVAVVGANTLGTAPSPFVNIYAAKDYSAADTASDPDATRAALISIGTEIGAALR